LLRKKRKTSIEILGRVAGERTRSKIWGKKRIHSLGGGPTSKEGGVNALA